MNSCSTHDSFIWSNSKVKKNLIDGYYGENIILGKQNFLK